jgi:hypothetical protein
VLVATIIRPSAIAESILIGASIQIVALHYAGALLMFVGTPLLLGSWWGLLFAPLGALGIGGSDEMDFGR